MIRLYSHLPCVVVHTEHYDNHQQGHAQDKQHRPHYNTSYCTYRGGEGGGRGEEREEEEGNGRGRTRRKRVGRRRRRNCVVYTGSYIHALVI